MTADSNVRPVEIGSRFKAKILSGVGANAFGQAVTMLVQLISVPVFLHVWDVALYGVWLLLSAIPVYFMLVDMGFVSYASNRMNMLMAAGRTGEANRVFQSTLGFLCLATVGLTVLTALALLILDDHVLARDLKIASFCLIVAGLLSILCELADAVYNANDHFAQGTWIFNTCRLVEWLSALLFLLLWGSIEWVAIGFLTGRLLSTLVFVSLCSRRFTNLRWGFADASMAEVKAMVLPAALLNSFPVSVVLTVQGTTLLVGHFLGPAAVAAFSALRTLSRLVYQATFIFGRAIWPEFSRQFGARNFDAARSTFRYASALCGLLALGGAALLYLLSPWLLRLWTGGQIRFDPALFNLLLLGASLASLQLIAQIFLISTIRHRLLALLNLGTSVMALAGAAAAAPFFGSAGVAMLLAAAELVMMVGAILLVHRVFREHACLQRALPCTA
jgi:O-antigen/teichoic acid export membrane protein